MPDGPAFQNKGLKNEDLYFLALFLRARLRSDLVTVVVGARTPALGERRQSQRWLFREDSRVDTDLSCGSWKWIDGPEFLPHLGGTIPRRGIAALIDLTRHPGAYHADMYHVGVLTR